MTDLVTFDVLNFDILLEIIKHLSLNDLLNLNLVNKKLYDLITCNYVLKMFKKKIIKKLNNVCKYTLFERKNWQTKFEEIFNNDGTHGDYKKLLKTSNEISQYIDKHGFDFPLKHISMCTKYTIIFVINSRHDYIENNREDNLVNNWEIRKRNERNNRRQNEKYTRRQHDMQNRRQNFKKNRK